MWDGSDTSLGGGGGGGGVLPIIAYTRRLHVKGVPFQASGIYDHEGVGISLFEVYERVGNLPFRSVVEKIFMFCDRFVF